VGIVEEALQLPGKYSDFRRGLLGVGLLAAVYGFWSGNRAIRKAPDSGAKIVIPFCIGIIGYLISSSAVPSGPIIAFNVTTFFAVNFIFGRSTGVTAVVTLVSQAILVFLAFFLLNKSALSESLNTLIIGAAVIVAITAIAFFTEGASNWSIRHQHHALYLFITVLALLVGAFASAYFLSTSRGWTILGPLIAVLGLLTVVNAPFDWVALGLTRALLRRGLAPNGRGPYFYSLIDAIIALPLITLLAFVTIVAVQTFDDIAGLYGVQIFPLDELFEGLRDKPRDAEFWWIWLMLFSTLIPSLINLAIGASAFLRGIPFLNDWILRRMPTGSVIDEDQRTIIASALASQLVGGILITGVLLYLLATYIVPLGLPMIGAYIRDFSAEIAAYDAPARLLIWITGLR